MIVAEDELNEGVNEVKEYFLKMQQENIDAIGYTAVIAWTKDTNRIVITNEDIYVDTIPEEERNYITKVMKSELKRKKYLGRLLEKLNGEFTAAEKQCSGNILIIAKLV